VTRQSSPDSTPVPLVDLRAQYRTLREKVLAAIESVLESMQLNLGPNVRAFEQEFASYCGTQYAVGVGSGTEALHLALLAVGVGPGDEVITSAHTFFATVEAILLCGARPVLCDVRDDTLNIDPEQVERRVTPRTRAIIPVHMHGQPAEMDALLDIGRRAGVAVIEDACQAHGARYRGRRAGSLGDAGCFSFYVAKNLGAYGEAGAVVTSNPEIARAVAALRDHGSEERYHHNRPGVNSRLDEIQAAVLRVKLPYLDEWNDARRRLAGRYGQLLAGANVRLPFEHPDCTHVYHHYAVRVADRDRLREHLQAKGIATGIHYPVPLHLQPALASYGWERGTFPNVERAANELLSLPMYAELQDADAQRVAAAVLEFQARDRPGVPHAREVQS